VVPPAPVGLMCSFPRVRNATPNTAAAAGSHWRAGLVRRRPAFNGLAAEFRGCAPARQLYAQFFSREKRDAKRQ
jgi:hypothetical protein